MPLNVLVVDDSDVIRSMILKTLRLADVPLGTAFEASNGKEALDIIDANWVDVVLADINMPVMDGIEMLRRLRSDDRNLELPVIVVTTEGTSERVAEIEAAGVTAYVKKPFTPETIRNVVDDVTANLPTGLLATESLMKVFTEVLERFVMLDGAPAGAEGRDMDEGTDHYLQASMTFRGAVTGVITVVAPFALCVRMAANAIGIDETHDAATVKAADVLGEVANMACGSLVLELEPDKPTDLSPPVVVGIDHEQWMQFAALPTTIPFDVEGEPALVSCLIRPSR